MSFFYFCKDTKKNNDLSKKMLFLLLYQKKHSKIWSINEKDIILPFKKWQSRLKFILSLLMYMERHAYLIMAHDKFEQLFFLLSLLDDKRNDIYLHLDKKADFYEYEKITASVTQSNLYIVESSCVNWGGFSVVSTEMKLIKAAINNGEYAYLHLLSGTCLPIKSQDYIHDFFNRNKGREFVKFAVKESNIFQLERMRYYVFWQEKRGYKKNWLYTTQNFMIRLQRKARIDRLRNIGRETLNSGSQWFSITSDFAKWILGQIRFIDKHFKYTICADEFFIHTLLTMSPYLANHVNDSLRYVVWEGGWHPRWLELKDKDALINTPALFARKFDLEKEPQMKEVILELLSNTRQPIE